MLGIQVIINDGILWSGNTLGDLWKEWLSAFRARDAGKKRAGHVAAIETYRRVDFPQY